MRNYRWGVVAACASLMVSIVVMQPAGGSPQPSTDEAVVLVVGDMSDGPAADQLRGALLWASLYSLTGQNVVVSVPQKLTFSLDDCGPEGGGLRLWVGEGSVSVFGRGSTVQQMCDGSAVLRIEASGAGDVLLDGVTLRGGATEDSGGGISFIDKGGATGAMTLRAVGIVGNTGGDEGGGIYSEVPVALERTTVAGNVADYYGGGLYVEGHTKITSSIIYANAAGVTGGGVLAHGEAGVLTLDVQRSFVVANHASLAGGGLAADGVSMFNDTWVDSNWAYLGGGIQAEHVQLHRSTVSGNEALDGAGVVAVGSADLSTSTVSGNRAKRTGGGLMVSGKLSTVASTIVDNLAGISGSNVEVKPGGTWAMTQTVVAGGDGSPDCLIQKVVANAEYSFGGDGSCGLAGSGNISGGGDPLLGPLAANGGLTPTRVPLGGSPLLDVVPSSLWSCKGQDQRGVSRPQNVRCDIGSVER